MRRTIESRSRPALTWSIASWYITIAPSISSCCDADSGDQEEGPTARWIFTFTCIANSYSFSGPGGSGARHRGHVSDTPFDRSSPTHPPQNECPHGNRVGAAGFRALAAAFPRLAALERLHLLRTALTLDASRGEHLAQLLRLHALAVDLALLCERAAHEQGGHEARHESHRPRRAGPNSRTFGGQSSGRIGA